MKLDIYLGPPQICVLTLLLMAAYFINQYGRSSDATKVRLLRRVPSLFLSVLFVTTFLLILYWGGFFLPPYF